MRTRLFNAIPFFRTMLWLLCLLPLWLGSCQKRSQCPTYWDSDPKILFGDETLLDRQKDMAKRITQSKKSHKRGGKKKGAVPGLGKSKKSKYKKQRPKKKIKKRKAKRAKK
jgi:hypothetical protein